MRSEEELCPSNKRVAVNISNLRLVLDEIHVEPLFNITLEILKLHSIINSITLTIDAPEIYMQQFWHTVYKDERNKKYYFYLDYQHFDVGTELLRHALKTSPRKPDQPLVKPPCQDELVTFIKKLGYVDSLTTVSQVVVNKLHQHWRTFLSILNKCITWKAFGVDRAREPIIQIMWGLVNSENINFTELIWEYFRFQINNRKNKSTKQERLPYPRFTKLIFQHLLSDNENLNKQSKSTPHKISEEELVEKLMFVAKGEPKGKPAFRMPILEVMMSREVKESDAYLYYLAKYSHAQFGAPTLGRGKVLEKDVNKQVDEVYDAWMKLKLKAQKHVSHDAQLLLNLKKGYKGSKRQHIIKEIRKAPEEGSGAIQDSQDHSDSSNESIWNSTNDDKIESEKDSNNGDESDNSDHGDENDDSDKDSDAGEDQTTDFGIFVHDKEQVQTQPELQPHSPSATITSHEDVSWYLNDPSEVEMTELLNKPMYTESTTLTVVPLLNTIHDTQEDNHVDQVTESPPAATTTITLPTKTNKKQAKNLLKKAIQRQNDSKKAIMQRLEEHEQKLNALA
ncbi:hypothetical protein Tco_1274503 [Tanacetum coccineum]